MKTLIYSLNGRYYERAINIFMLVVASHFLEHTTQMSQLYLLHWDRSHCLGFLGLIYPPLMTSEWLHYLHALFMLLGLAAFRIPPLVVFGGSWRYGLPSIII